MVLPTQVQRCTLLNIKSGGCPEDCTYCSQSSKHSKETGTKAEKLMDLESVYEVGNPVALKATMHIYLYSTFRRAVLSNDGKCQPSIFGSISGH